MWSLLSRKRRQAISGARDKDNIMRNMILAAAASLALVACMPAGYEEQRDDAAARRATVPKAKLIGESTYTDVYKLCDAGRAVYVTEDDAIFVVPDATECQSSNL